MKKIYRLFMLLTLLTLLSACSLRTENSGSSNHLNSLEKVTLTFVQHTFLNFSYNESKEVNGYYFQNDELAKTSFEFFKGYNLSLDDINNFNTSSLNYKLPNLVGDGYWSFTYLQLLFMRILDFQENF